jgi:hypothetical protein
MGPISLHRIFSLDETNSDHIEGIDEVDSEDTHRGGNLASDDDGAGCYDKTEHDGACITDESRSLHIEPSHKKCRRYDNRHESEEELGVLLYHWIAVYEIELQCESCHDDEAHESETTSQSRNPIRKIDRVKYEYIPKNGNYEWNIVNLVRIAKDTEVYDVLIESQSISKYT